MLSTADASVIFEQYQERIQAICEQLAADTNALTVLLVNKDAHEIAGVPAGDEKLSLASLLCGDDTAWALAEKDFWGKLARSTKTDPS